MQEILTDLSTPSLTRAIKRNLYEFFSYLRHARETEFGTGSGIVRWHTTTPHPWFNGLLSARLPLRDEADTIAAALNYFRSRAVASFTWWLEPDIDPAPWQQWLAPYGFAFDNSTPGMAIDLEDLRDDLSTTPNLRIAPVEDTEMLRVWTRVFIAGYELPAAWEANLFALMAGLGLELPMRNYLAYLGDKPVATSNLFLGAGVAGVQFVATLPAARGRGIGAAISAAPLAEARQLGYRAAILQSSEMGYRVYERLGFKRLCQMEHFYWEA